MMRKVGPFRFRFDTRIYLEETTHPSKRDRAVAAVIGKNPGSAMPTETDCLTRLNLDDPSHGRLPRTVRRCFLLAYERAGLSPRAGDFIQSWNLFYLTDPDLKAAKVSIGEMERYHSLPICASEQIIPPIVWFAWGRPEKEKLAKYAIRFLQHDIQNPFYYCMSSKRIVTDIPAPQVGAKHTQGLPVEPIVGHLAGILKS
ncbi:hypothetical protein U8335_23760 [Roseiconus lacunae]|uniref:hypothetical protein n=1 Tax=Roseiconus lacunae TaxID=2605694 RepID=UPI0011F21080|nr:hypothetical protein [Roseiconus lacunae]WRQ49960.1 hypothetical protein U8335_23760 [Stieleria sp. HD01]